MLRIVYVIMIGILPYPLRRDLRTNFYRYYLSAVHSIKNGNLDEAEEVAALARNIIREKREAFLSFYLTGCIKAIKGDWSSAKYYLENALNIAESREDSIYVEPWLLYVYYNDEGLYATYELGKSFRSGIPEERVYMALFLVDEERYPDALNILDGLNTHEANYIRAFIYYKLNKPDSALHWLSTLKDMNDIEKVFYATLLYNEGKYKKAYKMIKGTSKSDVYQVWLQALIESKLKSDNLFLTYQKYKTLLEGKPEFGKIALITAKMYFEKKEYGKVVNILEDIWTSLSGEDKNEALLYLGTAYVFLKRYATALKIWRLLLQDKDHYDYVRFQLGRCAYELELDSVAMDNLMRVHDTSAYYFWGLYLVARGLIRLHSKRNALYLLEYIANYPVERSLKRRVYYNLGKLLIEKKKWDSAAFYLKKLLQLGFSGWDIDSAEYLYEFCMLQTGQYKSPVELNLVFTKKYPDNRLVPLLLDEVFTYYLTRNKKDSAFYILFVLRKKTPSSMYFKEFKKFINTLNLKDTQLLRNLVDTIKSEGTYQERRILAEKLIELSDGVSAIDVLEGVTKTHRRDALLLFAKAYEVMGQMPEEELVLKEAFPPFDSIGCKAFKKLALIKLKSEGMDSFYAIVFSEKVPVPLKMEVLKEASEELFANGDTLNALEIRSRLKELRKEYGSLGEN